MGAATDGAEIVRLSKEHAELKPVADAVQGLARARAEMADLEAMTADPEMAAMAQDELQLLNDALPGLERDVALLLAPRDADENASAVLEVRAGTGGDEAALFAGDLFRMYSRYASTRGWRIELDSATEGDAGGYKEIIATVTGEGVFGRLKFESGVHRVQRVPTTEAGGRIHTFRASGSGGQHVNKTDSAVRITHLPTGIVATSSEKSQHVNRDKAMRNLRVRLYDMQRQAKDLARADSRKSQVGSGDRSERIRTYNFPQGRVTDHRIGLTLHSLPQILEGDIDPLLNALIAEDQAARLADLEAEFG